MKKILLVLVVFCCFSMKAFSQDIIVKNDKSEIKAKVLEITNDLIMYKKYEMQEGPSYSVKKVDVQFIKYENGKTELFDKSKTVEAKTITKKAEVVASKTIETEPAISTGKKTVFGIQGSLLSAACFYENSSSALPISLSAILGFKGGFFLDIPLSRKFSFTPSLNYVSKGGKLTQDGTVGTTKYNAESTIKTNFIELPLNFIYTSGGRSGLMLGFGPVLSYGIGGSVDATNTTTTGGVATTKNTGSDIKFDGDEHPTDGNSHLNAFEFGANLLIGYKVSPKFNISVNYDMGLTNLAPQVSGTTRTFITGYLGLNIGVGF